MRTETVTWVGGEHEFALTLPLLLALQQRCDGDGVGLISQRVYSGRYTVKDLISVLSLGLEGGGMRKSDAIKAVRDEIAKAEVETLSWSGGEAEFGFSIDKIERVEAACGAGIGEVYARLLGLVGGFKVQDAVQPTLIGRVGDGEFFGEVEAAYINYGIKELKVTATAALGTTVIPILNSMCESAQKVLTRALEGWPDDEGKPTGEAPQNP